jgi:hypothetical protein
MAIPVLKLNLAPPPSLWRRHHSTLGWLALALGGISLALAGGFSWRAYQQANRMGREAFLLSRQTQEALTRQGNIQAQLRAINVQKELPRWRLAERILGERSSPWSRLTAELERSLVQDVRIRTLQRTRGSDQQVVVKLKGEARTREAEAAFVESVQENPFFAQLLLERESERQGGGIEFEYTLPLAATPPPYQPLPKFGPSHSQAPTSQPPATAKPIQAKATPPAPTVAAESKPVQAPPPVLRPPQRPGSQPTSSETLLNPRVMREPRPMEPGFREGMRRRPESIRPEREVKR